MKTLLRILLILTTLAISSATCVTYFSSYFEPDKLGNFVLVQYAFPYLWALNALMAVLYLIFNPDWKIVFPVLAAILTYNGAVSVFNISSADIPSDKSIKVLTYNVHYMSLASVDSIGEFIKTQDADIVCMQEADLNCYNKIKNWLTAYPYFLDHKVKKPSSKSGDKQLLLSKYPVKVKSVGVDVESYLQCVEISIDGKPVTLFNCHLASIGLVSDEINVFDPSQLPEQNKGNVKKQLSTTRSKMTDAYHRRQEQATYVAKAIESVKTPLLICGDFNDTPISYTYYIMRKRNMKDSFVEAGNGWGDTYNGNLPPIRIDYILHSEDMKAIVYKEHDVDFSDHFPVSATLVLKD